MSEFLTITPGEIPQPKLHGFLIGAVAPRPIALASTIDPEGRPNLSPFSFFNVFSSNPPVVIFSPARRGRDGSVKNSYENALEIPEVVINVVSYPIIQQVNLASVEFPKGENEFIRSGLTPIASELVRPFRVKESPAQMECRVLEVKSLGTGVGAGNLIICEVVRMHISKSVLNENGGIDLHKIDLIGRMGGENWVRASGSAVIEVEKALMPPVIGYDGLPEFIRQSEVLTGNDIARLGNMPALPTKEETEEYIELARANHQLVAITDVNALHRAAAVKISAGDKAGALKLLMAQQLLF